MKKIANYIFIINIYLRAFYTYLNSIFLKILIGVQ